jgi:hypothetical protein
MNFNIKNRSNLNLAEMKPFLQSFLPFAQKEMGFNRPVDISFISDPKNSEKVLGKTAFYDPNTFSVSVYTDQRHPKDIMRSLSHELVHHAQNCRGEFDKKPEIGEGYFQVDTHMRNMEREAYEVGNMCFRMWEETYKKQLQESIYYSTGDTKMSYKNWRNTEMNSLLLEKWGYQKGSMAETAEEELEEAKGEKGDANPLGGARAEFDYDLDGVPDGGDADKDDPSVQQEAMMRKTIREAITKALKSRKS